MSFGPPINFHHLQATAATEMLPDLVYPSWLYANETAPKPQQQDSGRLDFHLTPRNSRGDAP